MKQNQLTLVVAVIAILALGIIWYAAPSPHSTPAKVNSAPAATLSTDEPVHDFGTISMAKGKVSHVFQLKNSGTEPVLITKIYTSCMCTEAMFVRSDGRQFGPFGMPGHGTTAILAQTIKPGETFSIMAMFDPAAHGPAGVGQIERIIYLETAGGTKELEIKALVQP